MRNTGEAEPFFRIQHTAIRRGWRFFHARSCLSGSIVITGRGQNLAIITITAPIVMPLLMGLGYNEYIICVLLVFMCDIHG